MQIDLAGRTAVITGASRGLGEEMAKALAASGARVALIARDAEKLEGVRRAITDKGGKADVFIADVTKESDVEALPGVITDRFGPAQILINNAGTNLRKNLLEFSLDEFRGVVDSSLVSTFLMCRAFVPAMRGTGFGRILNMTSIMSHISLPGRTAYSAAKASVLGLTKALALELAPEGITVNGISPGPIGIGLNVVLMNNPEANAQFLASLPVGRWGKPEEISALACYLCSQHSGFITGTDIVIDGGWMAK